MLLSIAASNSQLVPSDGPGVSATAAPGSRSTTSAVAEQAKALFFEGGGRPVSIDRGGYGGAWWYGCAECGC